ncbi:MAG TPA: alpha/beta fold hydrolase [Alphaproteobacteria bacterium]|nr:alpha/beta fold hydrolase [Alphaproteobacteria bacterium]
MAEKEISRRLVAILAADIAGYTRLMEQDTDGTVAAWHEARSEVIDPAIARLSGRIVKHTGDGFLAEFATAQDAVNCAIAMQNELAASPLEFRMGVNLGDVIDDGEDIHGEGVNLAARLEGLADPGSICLSGLVYEAVRNRIEAPFEDLGDKTVKHVSAPLRVWRIGRPGGSEVRESATALPDDLQQEIRFCQAADGVTIAYATVGDGPPLVKAPNWMHHLEYDWQSPVWGHLLRAFARDHTLVRFDQRGNGLSDWNAPTIDFDSMVDDLASVIEVTGLERFPLFGISQGCSYSIAYAIRHPEKVSRLLLYGGFAKGGLQTGSEADQQMAALETQMIREGWGQDNPAFRQFFTTRFMPGASKEQMDWFNEMQRNTTSPETAARLRGLTNNIDVSDLLAGISVPTLVLHCRDDGIVPFDAGRRMAASIPGARFVALEGHNHLILEDEPAWPRFLQEARDFLATVES